MKNGAEEKKLSRECLISTGATAPFPALIAAVLGEDCIQQFADLGYTKLVFQAGDALRYLYEIKPEKTLGVEIEAFDFNREGLTKQMKACIGRAGKSKEGLVICHAGAGTILDAMRMGLPIIVVPNPTLLDNHQEELAQELQRQGYVLKSDVK
ncbi:glycosyltransferase family 1 protein [Amorphotheca resinae ATCC 22711]|uniref:UDP-N-acetylglucosamine transferase subunit ALG13 n=1 Tax=Amorphotheca resinae ATCC 22711 TaxID=857342 RepID=A0A2T3BD77_AMORE|nr:glycosyltransferase family 1 protein [Amorphotheca resinae ATCC 22711]PSS27324.1 glycosyltransferase family 1 protein [Amorphotheca resinae ATCC 22711]